jgi:1-acyl-sn-glycerol-3-phosphate acyltransferase
LKTIFKNIFARFWAVWGLITFVTTFMIVLIPTLFYYLFKNKIRGQKYFIFISNIWMRIWLCLIGCRLTISGKNNFIENKNYIVVFNHNALLDIPLSAPFVPGAHKTIGKASFSKVPLFGLFYKIGAILIDRGDEKSRTKSYEDMKQVLNKGMHMCIYPEGTRNRTNQVLKPFFDGAFKLSVETQNEIIPCIITGTKTAMPIDKVFYLLPTKLSMMFLPAVSPEGFTAKTMNVHVHELMTKALLEKK